ncbi:MAG: hypothetical protein ACHP7I_05570 [Terriglobales bacterium]
MKVARSIFFVFGCCVLLSAGNGPASNRRPNGELQGTINVVLSNTNGAVVLTDSRLSSKQPDGSITPMPSIVAQKLFQLDEYSVCALADLVTKTVPEANGLGISSPAIINGLARELNEKKVHLSVAQKLGALELAFTRRIEVISTIEHVPVRVELIVAGYDADGILRIGGYVLRTERAPGSTNFHAVREDDRPVTAVAPGLRAIFGGIRITGEGVMQALDDFPNDPILAKVAARKRMGTDSTLPLNDLIALATDLKGRTETLSRGKVGGPEQVAVLENGRARLVHGPTFSFQPPELHVYAVLSHNEFYGGGVSVATDFPTPILYSNVFIRLEQVLDNAVFSDNEFRGCVVRYNGGITKFDESNKLVDTVLVLGRGAARNPYTRKLKSLPWREIREERGPSSGASQQ